MKFDIKVPDELRDEPKLDGRKTVLIEKELEDDLRKIPRDYFLETTREFWRALNEEFKKKTNKAS